MLETTSEVLSFLQEMEETTAVFYEAAAVRYPAMGPALADLVAEGRRFIKQAQRAYYGAVTDAFEGSFAFSMEPSDYAFSGDGHAPDPAAVAGQARDREGKLAAAYRDAAAQSAVLMPEVARVLALLAKKHDARQERLAALPSG